MDGDSRHSQFGGITVILVTLFLSFIAIAVFYILYRQFHGGWESLGVIDPWRNVLAHTLYQNKKPILWDVYIEGEKLEWEWGEFKPLSVVVFDTPSTRWQEISKVVEETMHVSTIIVFPSQRKLQPGYVQGAESGSYAIGTTEVRCCRGLTPVQ